MEEKLYCYGCGQILQCEDETKAGYVPDKILETKENILCQRCFKLQHYNTNSEVQLVVDDYITILKNIGREDALLVYVLDVFNFESSLIKDLNKYLGNNKILVLANKRDLIPSSVKDDKMLHWIKSKLADNKINNVIDIIMASGQTNYNVDLIMDKIDSLREGKDVYLIGNANVGKSTFINTLVNDNSVAKTSKKPGCTKLINFFDVNNEFRIVDVPGYGYAKASQKYYDDFENMMNDYLYERSNLAGIILLIDSRQEPSHLDVSMYNIIKDLSVPHIIVGTKSDQLNQSGKAKFKQNFIKTLKCSSKEEIYLVSNVDKNSFKAIEEKINEMVK